MGACGSGDKVVSLTFDHLAKAAAVLASYAFFVAGAVVDAATFAARFAGRSSFDLPLDGEQQHSFEVVFLFIHEGQNLSLWRGVADEWFSASNWQVPRARL